LKANGYGFETAPLRVPEREGAVVVFDLDGTLIESEQIWRDVRHDFVISNGGRWNDSAQRAMMGMRTIDWARYIHEKLGVTLDIDRIADQVVAAVAQRLQQPPILPGADEALARLADAFRLGVASSAALAVAQTVLRVTGWNRFFEVVVSADEVERGKPAPDVYARALALLDVDPSKAAAIEDSVSGIRSAYAAGLAVIAIPNHAFPPDTGATALASRIVANLDALDVSLVGAVLR
jgi:HAD superfamily hydrolase (TIGR01509 family)